MRDEDTNRESEQRTGVGVMAIFHGDWVHLNADGSVSVDENIKPSPFEWTVLSEKEAEEQWTDGDSLELRALPGFNNGNVTFRGK